MNPSGFRFPDTSFRVERSTTDEVNRQIEQQMLENIAQVAAAGPAAIGRRLKELDREWDIERTLEANASTIILLAVTLGFSTNRRWFALPFLVAGFLLLHAVQGWCPPMPILRRLGIRTEHEINLERTALRILRGDFRLSVEDAHDALALARTSPDTPSAAPFFRHQAP